MDCALNRTSTIVSFVIVIIILSNLICKDFCFWKYEYLLELLNNSSERDLSKLKSIGAKRAQQVYQYREQNGKFSAVTDLIQLDGFGEKFMTTFLTKNLT